MRGGAVLAAAVLTLLAASLAVTASAAPASVTVFTDIQYGEVGGKALYLDVYLPEADGPHPAVLVVHGGGWQSSSKRAWSVEAARLAEEGFVAVAPNFRMAPRFPYPAAVEDLHAAVGWIRDHAPDYGVDPARIGALGGSAGGHLAALLGTRGEGSRDAGARLRAVVSWSGPMDLETIVHQGNRRVRDAVAAFMACDVDQCQDRLREASPAAHVDATDSAIFLANGSDEVIPSEQAVDMAQALQEAGVPYRLELLPGDVHSRRYRDLTVGGTDRTVFEASMDFLKTWIENPRPQPGSGSGRDQSRTGAGSGDEGSSNDSGSPGPDAGSGSSSDGGVPKGASTDSKPTESSARGHEAPEEDRPDAGSGADSSVRAEGTGDDAEAAEAQRGSCGYDCWLKPALFGLIPLLGAALLLRLLR